MGLSNSSREAPVGEAVSRNASEPVSASKHKDWSGQSSELDEASMSREETDKRSDLTPRGDRGQRAAKE